MEWKFCLVETRKEEKAWFGRKKKGKVGLGGKKESKEGRRELRKGGRKEIDRHTWIFKALNRLVALLK